MPDQDLRGAESNAASNRIRYTEESTDTAFVSRDLSTKHVR